MLPQTLSEHESPKTIVAPAHNKKRSPTGLVRVELGFSMSHLAAVKIALLDQVKSTLQGTKLHRYDGDGPRPTPVTIAFCRHGQRERRELVLDTVESLTACRRLPLCAGTPG